MPTLRLNRRWAQPVPVTLGPIRADLAYEDALVDAAIASRAASRRQQELEEQRIALQSSRASRYAQARAQAQAQAQEQAQAQAQAQAIQNDRIPVRRREDEQTAQRTQRARRAQDRGYYVTLEHDQFGPILPSDLQGPELHPGNTGNHVADLRFWTNQLEVENSRLLDLHTRNPILDFYANVRVENLLETLRHAGVQDEVARQEYIIRHNIIDSRDWIRTYTDIIRTDTERREATQQQVRDVNLPTLTDIELTLERNLRQEFYKTYAKYSEVCGRTGQAIEPIPDEFLCPLSYDFMVNPVYEDGADFKRTYERSNIYKAISQQLTIKPRDQPRDPFTRQPIYVTRLRYDTQLIGQMDAFNRKMFDVINDYMRTNPNARFEPFDALASGKQYRKIIHSIKRRKIRQTKQRKARQTRQRKSRQTRQTRQRGQATIGKKSKKQYTKRHY